MMGNNVTGPSAWSPADMLDRLGGDEELARQLVELFIAECPRMLSTIRESVARADADAVRRAAHAFKGSVGNFTDAVPTTTAFALEQVASDGALERAPGLLARLEQEVEQFLAALRRFDESRP
jgi:HPt (histidine-containing phosphotransfer) domain-containing protein